MGAVAGFLVQELDLFVLLSYWGDRAPWVVAAAGLGALSWPTRLRVVVATLAGALGLAWLLVAFTPVCRLMANGLDRRDPLARADAVFALASSIQFDGDLTDAAQTRLLHSLELLGQELAPRLILSELPPPHPSYAERSRQIMDHLGLHHEILTVGPVTNTHEEAVAVGALCRDRGWTRLLVVTDPAHSRRASAALEREGLEVISAPATETQFDYESLAFPDERLRAFGPLIHEWVGLAYYRWRGWL